MRIKLKPSFHYKKHGGFHQSKLHAPRVAVIGSGPAGFYTAYGIMKRLPEAKIDMFETLPTPFGLVRYGVAPDHPEVKVAESKNFTYTGNISIGKDISLQNLARHYNGIVFAYGASRQKTLGIPGEGSLEGVYNAQGFVGWYNGLPQCQHLKFDLSYEQVAIIGHGNVALDVARILLTPLEILQKTDITKQALDVLSKSKAKQVTLYGRRGPLEAAFTIKELRELIQLPNLNFKVDADIIPPTAPTAARPQRRMLDLLRKTADLGSKSAPTSCRLQFFRSPIAFLGTKRLEEIEVCENVLKQTQTGVVLDQTNQVSYVAADMAFQSIGYQSEPLCGFDDVGIPFDKIKKIIPNDKGRVRLLDSTRFPPTYASGWVKRGPVGVIASTMDDAFETADMVVSDLHDAPSRAGLEGLKTETMLPKTVSWEDWKIIDQAEIERGRQMGKPREKFLTVQEMLSVVDQ